MVDAKKTQKSSMPNFRISPKGSVDAYFMVTVFILLAFGLIMVYSASSASAYHQFGDNFFYMRKQLIWGGLGIFGLFFFANFNYHKLSKLSLPILIGSIILLALVPIVGVSVNGARRWLGIGQLTFQPSEVAKYAIVIFFSFSLSKNYESLKKFKGLLPYLGLIGIYAVLLMLEPHFSGTLLIAVTALFILFSAGARIWHFILLFFPVAAGGAALVIAEPYRWARVTAFMDPFADLQGDGWQTVQSLFAIGSGGLFGVGLGQSRQKFLYLPEPQNDFIFSVLCEELGWIGAILVIGLFVFLIWRGFKIASKAPDLFGTLLATGIITLIAVQALVNIAVVTSSMPVTGMPLPFFSAGGSVLTFTLMGMGIMLNISKQADLA